MSKGHFLNGKISLTRNTKGHYWDENGILQTVATDEPRWNHNPKTGLIEGVTIMGQWTNEILDPRDMTTGNWGGSATVARNQVGIDGESNTACQITDDDSSGYESVSQDITVSNNSNTHTLIAYVKKKDSASKIAAFRGLLQGGTNVDYNISINEETGDTFINSDDASSSHEVNDKGDWWEVVIKIANNGTGNTSLRWQFNPSIGSSLGDNTASGTGSSIIDVASVFLNRSSPPPTPVYGEVAGQSYTQDPDIADVATLADIDYNADESTFSIEFNSAYSEGTLFDLHSDANNRIYAHRNASNEVHLVIVDGGTTQADLNLGTIADNTAGKIAVGWKENDIAGCLNAGTVKTDAIATLPVVSTLNIGRDYNDTNYWDAFIGQKLNYPRKLTSNQIQDESTV